MAKRDLLKVRYIIDRFLSENNVEVRWFKRYRPHIYLNNNPCFIRKIDFGNEVLKFCLNNSIDYTPWSRIELDLADMVISILPEIKDKNCNNQYARKKIKKQNIKLHV